MKLNKDAYTKLINDDAKWIVENTKDCLERQHILKILWDSIGCYYPVASQCVNAPDTNIVRCAVCGDGMEAVCKKCQSVLVGECR